MDNQWYVTIEGEQRGPLSAAELKQLVADGTVGPDTAVHTPEHPMHLPARKVKGLFQGQPRADDSDSMVGDMLPSSAADCEKQKEGAHEEMKASDEPPLGTQSMQWHVMIEGKVQGPITTAELRQLADDGRIREDTLVQTDELAPFPAGSIQNLFSRTHPVAATQWYVTVEGEQKGPLTDTDVRRWVEDGRINRDTFVRVGIDGEWQPAGDHVGLFDPQREEALAEALPTEDEGTPFIETSSARSNSTRSRSQRAPSFLATHRLPIAVGLGCLPALIVGILFLSSGRNRPAPDSSERSNQGSRESKAYDTRREMTRQELQSLASKVNETAVNTNFVPSALVEDCDGFNKQAEQIQQAQRARDDVAVNRGFCESEALSYSYYSNDFVQHVDSASVMKLLKQFALDYYQSNGTYPWGDSPEEWTSELGRGTLTLVAWLDNRNTLEVRREIEATLLVIDKFQEFADAYIEEQKESLKDKRFTANMGTQELEYGIEIYSHHASCEPSESRYSPAIGEISVSRFMIVYRGTASNGMVVDYVKLMGRARKSPAPDVVLKCEYQDGEWKVVRGNLEEVSPCE